MQYKAENLQRQARLGRVPCCIRVLHDPLLTNGFHPFTHLSIHPFMHPSRPPASLHHVRRWVIGSGSSHYGVPVECSSSSPLMRGLCFSPSHWTDRSELSPPEHLSQLGWGVKCNCKNMKWYTPHICMHTGVDIVRRLVLSLLIQHSDGLSFDYTTVGYILKFPSSVRRSFVAFVNCRNPMFYFGSSFEGNVCSILWEPLLTQPQGRELLLPFPPSGQIKLRTFP